MNDLFSPQGTLFDEVPEISLEARQKRIRARLHDLLTTARAADKMPWNRQREGVFDNIFHQSSNWLPPEEQKELCTAFDKELARLRAGR